jgi:hypothetical protein
LTTAVLQALIVEFGSIAFRVAEDGLEPKFWALSLILGSLSLPVQQLINFIYRLAQRYNINRNKKRKRKDGHRTTERANGDGKHPHSERPSERHTGDATHLHSD